MATALELRKMGSRQCGYDVGSGEHLLPASKQLQRNGASWRTEGANELRYSYAAVLRRHRVAAASSRRPSPCPQGPCRDAASSLENDDSLPVGVRPLLGSSPRI